MAEDQHGPVEPSFRVLDRSELPATTITSVDSGTRMMGPRSMPRPKSNHVNLSMEDNLFVDMKNNRGSGSSNTTKTTSDNSSRHSNASTAPSSTDLTTTGQDDWRMPARKPIPLNDVPLPPPPPKSGGFLKHAGRTFSFGTKKNSLPATTADDPVPPMPDDVEVSTPGRRTRAPTESSVSTATPPKVEDRDFMKDLGGDLSNMLSAFKRSSVVTVKDESGRQVLPSRNLTGNRISQQPSPLHLDKASTVEPPQHSWHSQHSNEGLLGSGRGYASPGPISPPIPSPLGRPRSEEADEDAKLLSDSLAATKFLSNDGATARNGSSRGYRRDEDSLSALPSKLDSRPDEDNLFYGRTQQRPTRTLPRAQTTPQGSNKVMTPAEFEQYRNDKVKQQRQDGEDKDDSDNEETNYDDDEDEREKTRQLAKQRLKQEAQMTVYRQQMMKVTGESNGGVAPPRPSLSVSMSTPNLPGVAVNENRHGGSNSPPLDASDEDEEVPLAILAAHGFPNKNRPPTRLSTMASNPNLRSSIVQPSYPARPGSAAGDAQTTGAGARGSLPAFARRLPSDPFLGAGLVNQRPRESFALGGGSPAPFPSSVVPPGGLVGVIANEERQRAMRRGSPAVDHVKNALPPNLQMPIGSQGFDPMTMGGMPSNMMYPMGMPQQMPLMTPGDQAQIQMTQQMQQFMQMQMQFMQMMAMQGQSQQQMAMAMPMPMQMPMQMPPQGPPRPQGHMPSQSMGSLPDVSRASFIGDPLTMGMGMSPGGSTVVPPRGDAQMRTMSMVQPSSASWIQPPQQVGPGYAPSIHVQGAGYAPSIAPSERSNIGLPNRYRPVSSINILDSTSSRTQTMSGALPTLSKLRGETTVKPVANDEDDDEEGWEKMKEKREKKKSLWRTKKSIGADIGALIS